MPIALPYHSKWKIYYSTCIITCMWCLQHKIRNVYRGHTCTWQIPVLASRLTWYLAQMSTTPVCKMASTTDTKQIALDASRVVGWGWPVNAFFMPHNTHYSMCNRRIELYKHCEQIHHIVSFVLMVKRPQDFSLVHTSNNVVLYGGHASWSMDGLPPVELSFTCAALFLQKWQMLPLAQRGWCNFFVLSPSSATPDDSTLIPQLSKAFCTNWSGENVCSMGELNLFQAIRSLWDFLCKYSLETASVKIVL